jgi:hypothetical protein
LNARYYDPSTGVFASVDELGDLERPKTLNPYSYAINNPSSQSDPSGDIVQECTTKELSCQFDGTGGVKITPGPQHAPQEIQVPDEHPGQLDIQIPDSVSKELERYANEVKISGDTADVTGLGLKLCTGSRCSRITQLVRRFGTAADAFGVVIECSDGMDDACFGAAVIAGAKLVPGIGTAIVVVQLSAAVLDFDPNWEIAEKLLGSGWGTPWAGDELAWDVEVHDSPNYPSGGDNPSFDGNALPVTPGNAGTSGFCPNPAQASDSYMRKNWPDCPR